MITFPTESALVNGDFTFDGGNLFVVQSSSTNATLSVIRGTVADLRERRPRHHPVESFTVDEPAVNGIAFHGSGNLYVSTTSSVEGSPFDEDRPEHRDRVGRADRSPR